MPRPINVLGGRSAASGAAPVAAPPKLTNNYRLRVRGNNARGIALDESGRWMPGYAGAGNDQMWSRNGYVSSKTTAAGTDGSVIFSRFMLNWNLNATGGQSLIVAMRVVGAAPAAATRWFGNCAGNSVAGFALSVAPDGTIGIRLGNGSSNFLGTNTTAVVFDNTGHFVIAMIDAKTLLASIWVDDNPVPSVSVVTLSGSTLNNTSTFHLGNAGFPDINPTMAVSAADLQIVTVNGGLPANYMSIVRALQADPSYRITTDVIPDRDLAVYPDSVLPITTGATQATKNLFNLLRSYCGVPEYILGAHDRFDDPAYAPNPHGYLQRYLQMCGKEPAMMQWEYVDINQPSDDTTSTGAQRQPNLIAAMREYASRGGINMVHDHAGHPVTGTMARSMIPSSGTGSAWDTTGGGLAAINTGGAREAQFLAYLDRLIAFAAAVEYPFVFRPFHEANASWFWWGGSAQAATFVAVWRKMVDYVRARGGTNILWCLNLTATHIEGDPTDNSTTPYSTWYPGDNYVDVLSVDYYNNSVYGDNVLVTLMRLVLREGLDAMDLLAAPSGKPIVFAEAGYEFASVARPDLWKLVGSDFASLYPDCASLGLWRSPWGPDLDHVSVAGLRDMVSTPECITLDKLVAE